MYIIDFLFQKTSILPTSSCFLSTNPGFAYGASVGKQVTNYTLVYSENTVVDLYGIFLSFFFHEND